MSDLVQNALNDRPTLTTKRVMMAQISVCKGCCCGSVTRGKPDVPVDWLKHEWKTRGLAKVVQLTISGCLGPCDLVNVIRISNGAEDVWLGRLCSLEDYAELVEWAERTKVAGAMAMLSPRLQQRRFDPFIPLNANGIS